MASLHKDPRGKSPFWYCAFISKEGGRHFRSTKTKDKRQAVQICNTWAKAAAFGDKLSPDKARQVIAQGVADLLMVSGQSLPSATIRDWCKRWLESKSVEAEPRTHERYETSIRSFLAFLGPKANQDLESLSVSDVAYSGGCRTLIPIFVGQRSDFCRTPFRFISDSVPG